MVPGHVVGHRRDVIHPISDSDVLVEIQMLADFLESRVQVSDVGNRLNNPLAVELQHQPQCRVRRRMLWAKVQGPEIVLSLLLVGW